MSGGVEWPLCGLDGLDASGDRVGEGGGRLGILKGSGNQEIRVTSVVDMARVGSGG